MITKIFTQIESQSVTPKEGDLYKEVNLFGKTFKLVYGYYEDFERESSDSEPIPIYPDFIKNPLYTEDGIPFVTAMQDICEHYVGIRDGDSCAECIHFQKCEELFGLCDCSKRRKIIIHQA